MFGELSRRNLMAVGVSAGVGLGLSSLGTPALAKAPKLKVQAPYWYRFDVGDAEITVVSDGWQMLGDPSNSFLGVPKEEVRKELTDNFMSPSDMNIELNSFVVNSNGRLVLFDTGLGASKMFGPKGGLLAKSLADAGINVDMIVQNIAHSTGSTDVTFTVPSADLARSLDVLEKASGDIGYASLVHDTRVAKISVVGVGMRSHAGVASTMFQTLGARGINILAITTSEIKVSVLIEEDYTELAVRVLHTAYGLDAEAA